MPENIQRYDSIRRKGIGAGMINQSQLFQLYRQMTGGSTVYVPKALPADVPKQRYQISRIEEYAFMQEVK